MSDIDVERDFAQSWIAEYPGRPITVVASEGYWQIPSDSPGSGEPQQTVISAERQYSLGILAADGEVQVEEDGLVVPVEGFVTWHSKIPYTQDLETRFKWGFEWFGAEVVAGKGGLILPRIRDPKDPAEAWDFRSFECEERVHTNGTTLGLRRGMKVEATETAPGGIVTDTFAEVEISVNSALGGNHGSRYIGTVLYRRDELLGRIEDGDVSALEEAANPRLKKAAEKAARQDLKRNPPREKPDYDPLDPLA